MPKKSPRYVPVNDDWAGLDTDELAAQGRMQFRYGSSILTDVAFVGTHREALTAHGFATDEATHPRTRSHGERGLVATLLGFRPDGQGGWQ